MENKNNIISLPSRGKTEPPSEDALNRVLATGGTKSSVVPDRSDDRPDVKSVPDFNAWKWGKRADVPKKQLPLFLAKIPPEFIPHVNASGCICANCKTSRGEKKQAEGAGVQNDPKKNSIIPEKQGSENPYEPLADPEEFFVDIVDEDMAGWIADFPRQIGELIVQIKKLGPEAEEVWAENKKEFDRQAKLALVLWQKYAHIPDFKYKHELFLVLMLTVNTLKRIVKTVAIISKLKK